MRFVTWNINSVRLRLPQLLQLAEDLQPDVICLQETKCTDDKFPETDIIAAGYRHLACWGMKSYNGVAILSRHPVEDVRTIRWVGRDDCRHIAARINGVDVHCVYVPSGGDIPDPKENDKFAHKLAFLDELAAHIENNGLWHEKMLICGDFNVAPHENDVWSHKQLLKVVSHTPDETTRLARLFAAGNFVDAVRKITPETEKLYSWWSYRARDWAKSDRGRRIDHMWVSPALGNAVQDSFVYKTARGWERPSDHAPVVADITRAIKQSC